MKKFLSMLLVAAISLNMSVTVFAESGTATLSESNTVTFSALDGTGTGSEGYAKLIDGKKTETNNSKWCTDIGSGVYVVIKASESVLVTGYTFYTANDNDTSTGRNPKTWKLYGCDDYDEESKSGTWNIISDVDNNVTMQDVNYTPYSFEASGNSEYYQYYKLEITAAQGGDMMQLGEMEFSYTVCEHNWTVISSTEADCTHPKYETKSCGGDCGKTITVPVGSPLGHTNNGSNTCTVCGKVSIQQVGNFTVSNAVKDEDYTYENNQLKILTDMKMTIRNTDPTTPTTVDHIVVAKNVSANIILAGVNIDVSGENDGCAFEIENDSGGNVIITVADNTTNILKSGRNSAGLKKEGTEGKLKIQCEHSAENGHVCTDSCGKLTASSTQGAGIGSGYASTAGAVSNITITGGVVTASSTYGAGIGSGYSYSYSGGVSNITITGGVVTASSTQGAGIGSGYASSYNSGAVSDITIKGGVVTAGSTQGAGIGSAGAGVNSGAVSDITIKGGVVTAGSTSGAGIGSGYAINNSGAVSNITIKDGVVTASSSGGAGIGSGHADGPNSGAVSNITIAGGLFTTAPSGYETRNVTFKPENGETDATYKAVKDTTITPLTAPVKNDFTFAGWYEKDDNGVFKDTSFDFTNTKVTGNIILYAKWDCNHSGGTADCTHKAVCTVCGDEYGEVDRTNHDFSNQVKSVDTLKSAATCQDEAVYYYSCSRCGKIEKSDTHTFEGEPDGSKHTDGKEWSTKNETQHKQTWKCCGAIEVALENHEWKDGVCEECGYICLHTGGTADCTHKAVCTVCGEEYGKLPPEIIDGKDQSLNEGETRELIFRSNAAFSDFIRVDLDGKTVDGKNYTVKEGSTIITLKADYVATLSAGEHTLGIVSESGTAEATFTVNAKVVDTKSPQTGDNSRMALWFALLFISGGTLAGTVAYSKKKKRFAR